MPANIKAEAPGRVRELGPEGLPLDMEHLTRQTLGDKALATEVLKLFQTQTLGLVDRMEAADIRNRRELAHALVGSARGIGAFRVAECAARIEKGEAGAGEIMHLSSLIDEVHEFISSLS
ncbi:Hpt domain-containing protein [Nitratireductor sp.]|uniref:Hpt domain-containing protein n=1 Tax=Nitratireductor sp. TaxID=1872084 RepID=UPI002638A8D4|nr:Hpt domain-containing protein [Nitratireductor sp.]MCV0377860.1 Hpt domain-containing protein [Nitratireductor sp.]